MTAASQKGISMLGALVLLLVLSFAASTAFRLVPHYLDFHALQRVITRAPEAVQGAPASPAEFYAHVTRGMQGNGIRDLDARSILAVRRQDNQFHVHLKYERRAALIGNLDVVVHFDRQYRVRAP